MDVTRRQLLTATVGAAGIGSLAGCTGESSDGTEADETTAQSSFFVFGDIAANVAGNAARAELLVPVGQHGHGWEPGPSVREDIRGADLLVHGMEGFQPWVDDVQQDLDADGADIATVDISAGLDLLEVNGESHDGHDETEDGHDDHDETEGGHDGHDETEDGHDGHNETEDGHDATEDSHDESTEDDHDGTEDGHNGTEDSYDETEHGHDHGDGMDPHFWLDPVRMKAAVGTVETAFADLDSDNADAYADNAEQFRAELDDLDERIAEMVANTATDTLLVAGHDSFSYLGDRYGVHVEALTNVSPDDRPTTQDIEHAQDIIAEHDLQYVCADPLESQRAAEQLVAETDAEAVLPLTAIPGLTDEWAENDWGYVEIMENVNIPTLERVFDE